MIVIITLVMVTSMAINLNRSVLIIMVLGVIIILMVLGMVVNFNKSVWSNFIIVEIIVFCVVVAVVDCGQYWNSMNRLLLLTDSGLRRDVERGVCPLYPRPRVSRRL